MADYKRRKEHTKETDLSGTDLTGTDLSGTDLTGTGSFDIHNTIEAFHFQSILNQFSSDGQSDDFQCHFFGSEYRLGFILI